MTCGASPPGILGTLQTSKSPFAAWLASMSDFCLDDEPCHDRPTIESGDSSLFFEMGVCKIAKCGRTFAMKIVPFWYLRDCQSIHLLQ